MAATCFTFGDYTLTLLSSPSRLNHKSSPSSHLHLRPFSVSYGVPSSSSSTPKPLLPLHIQDNKGRLGFTSIHRNGRSDFGQTSAVRVLSGSVTSAESFRFALVVTRFNEIVTRPLLEGALDAFKKYAVKEENIDVVWVPGSFEIGLIAEKLGKSRKYDAIVCIGAVIRGESTHYDAVANTAASGVLSASLNSGVPCIFGVLTCDDMDQALNRAGGKSGNKGAEAALTAIEMASFCEHHLKFPQ